AKAQRINPHAASAIPAYAAPPLMIVPEEKQSVRDVVRLRGLRNDRTRFEPQCAGLSAGSFTSEDEPRKVQSPGQSLLPRPRQCAELQLREAPVAAPREG